MCIRDSGYTYYMAEALLDTVLGKLNAENPEAPAYEVLETYTGKDLEYKAYEPPVSYTHLSANLPNTSKKPKYSLDSSFGMIFP